MRCSMPWLNMSRVVAELERAVGGTLAGRKETAMTRQEKRWLAIGIVSGALIAGAVGLGLFYRFPTNADSEITTHTGSSSKRSRVTGYAAMTPRAICKAAVQLSPDEQAKIGIQTTEVRRESITEDIIAIGRVEEPETAIATVSTRFGGRVERLFVNFTGQPVQKGDPVATIQSPVSPRARTILSPRSTAGT